MKINTANPTSILIKLSRYLQTILTIVLIVPVTVISQSSPAPINLGTAGDFVILAKTGISSTGTTKITGDIGISPNAASSITGFGLIEDASNTLSKSSLITGKVYAADYLPPTPAKMTTAINDMQTAYTNAAGRTLPDYTELYTGNLTGKTLTRGLYKWSTGVLISTAGVNISGTANDIWIFQIAQNLTVANGAIVTLNGGALASNIFWQVAGQVTLGTTAEMKGIILCQTVIAMNTGATLNGTAMAQTAVTLDANTVIKPITVTVVKNDLVLQKFALYQNYPNPFNPITLISYQISSSRKVSLKVFNILGMQVAELVNEVKSPGNFNVLFDGSKFASGVYYYQLRSGSLVNTKKLVLLK